MKYLLITIIILLAIFSTSTLLAADKSKARPKTAQDYIAEGLRKELIMDYNAAFLCYLDAIKADPNNSEAYSKLGKLRYFKGSNEVALKYLHKAFELNPNCENAYNLGMEYRSSSDFPNAIKYFLKAIDYNPEDIRTIYDIGIYCYNQKEYDQAILLLKKAISIDLKNSKPSQFTDSLYKSLAKTYEQVGNFEDATICYQKTSVIDSNYVKIQKRFLSMLDSCKAKNYIYEDFSSGNFSEKNFINDLNYKWKLKSTESDYKPSKDYFSPPNIKDKFTSELFYVFKIDTTCFLSIEQDMFDRPDTVQCYIDNSLEPKEVREYPLAKGNHVIKWKLNKKSGIVKEPSYCFLRIYNILITPVHSPKIKYEIVDYPFFEYFQTRVKVELIAQNPKDTIFHNGYYKPRKFTDKNLNYKLFGGNIQSRYGPYIKYESPLLYADEPPLSGAFAYRNGMSSLIIDKDFDGHLGGHQPNLFNEFYIFSFKLRSPGSGNYELQSDLSLFYFVRMAPGFFFIPSAWAVGIDNKGVAAGYIGYSLHLANFYYSFNSLGQKSFDMTIIVPLFHPSSATRIDLTGGYRYFDKKDRFYFGIGLAFGE